MTVGHVITLLAFIFRIMELDLYPTNYNRSYRLIRYLGISGLTIFFIATCLFGVLENTSKWHNQLGYIAIACLIILVLSTITQKLIKGGMNKMGILSFHDSGFSIQLQDGRLREFSIKELPMFRMKLTDYQGEIDITLQLNFSKNRGIENYIWTDREIKHEYYRFKIPNVTTYNRLIDMSREWERKHRTILVEH